MTACALVDPLAAVPTIWFQQMDAPRPQRNRIHIDIDVPHETAQAADRRGAGRRRHADGQRLRRARRTGCWPTPKATRPASAPGRVATEAAAVADRLLAVITRMSELFLRTLRDDPADAEVPSHKLLIRAGYVRPIGPGLYSWLPLGLRVLRKIEEIVRDEMTAIGGQEILFPALLPRGAVRDDRSLDRIRRRRVPAQGPPRQRLHARPDPRRAVHADGQGGVQLVQGLPADPVPNPDQVPRRGPARGPASCAAASSS